MSDMPGPHDFAEAPTLGMGDRPAHPDAAATEIGGYRILGKLGEGGMGIVYEAEQKSPLRRVALKVIRGGPFVDEIHLRMFRHETETLARLAHPNIAAIYEAGRTAEGQHFFTMELVAGRTLSAYLRDHLGGDRPTMAQLRERLRLFVTICRAVNYAHQRGVIHRDLKPTNVLVSESGDVKVLDFGLARIVDADASATLAREVGTIRGTLAYMSPEMARGGDVDVRSDVYTLGIMLYEMLAERAPYDTSTSSIVQAIRIICEQPPRVLSTTASGVPIDSDLRTLSAKALAKEPDERYQSAGAFADDVERWLANEPILAHPPSAAYQFRKYVARHKGQVAAVSAIAALLAALVVTMVVQARHVRIERDRATAAAAKAEAINGFLLNALGSADPWSRGSRNVTLMDALHQSEGNVHAAFARQPLVEAAVLGTLGSTFGSLAEYADADTALRASLAIRERESGRRSAETADALTALTSLYIHWERYPEAQKFADEALDIERQVSGPTSLRVVSAMNNLASIDSKIAKLSEAKALAEEELKIVTGPHPSEPGVTNIDWAESQSHALTILAEVALNQGDAATMVKLDRQRMAILKSSAPDDGAELATTLNDLATAEMMGGDLPAAESTYAEAIGFAQRTFGDEHPMVAEIRENLGNVHFREGKLDQTKHDLAGVLAIRRKALGDDSEPVGRTLANLAAVERKAGEYALSESTYREAIPKLEAKLGPDHPDVAIALASFGDDLRHQQKFVEAESTLRHALAVLSKAFGDQNAMTQRALKACADLYTDWKKPAEAASYTARLAAKK